MSVPKLSKKTVKGGGGESVKERAIVEDELIKKERKNFFPTYLWPPVTCIVMYDIFIRVYIYIYIITYMYVNEPNFLLDGISPSHKKDPPTHT